MAVAYLNREKSAWQRDMRVIIIIAVGQVVLGSTIVAIELLTR